MSSKPSIWHLVKTTLAAAVGVQTDANREKDFSQTSPFPYIVMGVIFTGLFVGAVVLVAKLAIA